MRLNDEDGVEAAKGKKLPAQNSMRAHKWKLFPRCASFNTISSFVRGRRNFSVVSTSNLEERYETKMEN